MGNVDTDDDSLPMERKRRSKSFRSVVYRSVPLYDEVSRSHADDAGGCSSLNDQQWTGHPGRGRTQKRSHAHRISANQAVTSGKKRIPGARVDADKIFIALTGVDRAGRARYRWWQPRGFPLGLRAACARGQLSADDWLRLTAHARHPRSGYVALHGLLDVVGSPNRVSPTDHSLAIYTYACPIHVGARVSMDYPHEESVAFLAQLAATSRHSDEPPLPRSGHSRPHPPRCDAGNAVGSLTPNHRSMLGQVSASGGLGVPLKAMASGSDLDPSPEARKARGKGWVSIPARFGIMGRRRAASAPFGSELRQQ